MGSGVQSLEEWGQGVGSHVSQKAESTLVSRALSSGLMFALKGELSTQGGRVGRCAVACSPAGYRIAVRAAPSPTQHGGILVDVMLLNMEGP